MTAKNEKIIINVKTDYYIPEKRLKLEFTTNISIDTIWQKTKLFKDNFYAFHEIYIFIDLCSGLQVLNTSHP